MTPILENNDLKIIEQLFRLWSKANEEILSTILNKKISLEPAAPTIKEKGELTPLTQKKEIFIFPMTVSSGLLGSIYMIFTQRGPGHNRRSYYRR